MCISLCPTRKYRAYPCEYLRFTSEEMGRKRFNRFRECMQIVCLTTQLPAIDFLLISINIYAAHALCKRCDQFPAEHYSKDLAGTFNSVMRPAGRLPLPPLVSPASVLEGSQFRAHWTAGIGHKQRWNNLLHCTVHPFEWLSPRPAWTAESSSLPSSGSIPEKLELFGHPYLDHRCIRNNCIEMQFSNLKTNPHSTIGFKNGCNWISGPGPTPQSVVLGACG